MGLVQGQSMGIETGIEFFSIKIKLSFACPEEVVQVNMQP